MVDVVVCFPFCFKYLSEFVFLKEFLYFFDCFFCVCWFCEVLRISCSSSALVGMFIIVFGMCISVLIVLSLCCWLFGYSRPSVRLACSTFGLSFSSSCRRVWSSLCSTGVWCVSIFAMLMMFAWVRWWVMCLMASVVVVVWVVIPISVCWLGDS